MEQYRRALTCYLPILGCLAALALLTWYKNVTPTLAVHQPHIMWPISPNCVHWRDRARFFCMRSVATEAGIAVQQPIFIRVDEDLKIVVARTSIAINFHQPPSTDAPPDFPLGFALTPRGVHCIFDEGDFDKPLAYWKDVTAPTHAGDDDHIIKCRSPNAKGSTSEHVLELKVVANTFNSTLVESECEGKLMRIEDDQVLEDSATKRTVLQPGDSIQVPLQKQHQQHRNQYE